mgnify:CR=1 FL=1
MTFDPRYLHSVWYQTWAQWSVDCVRARGAKCIKRFKPPADSTTTSSGEESRQQKISQHVARGLSSVVCYWQCLGDSRRRWSQGFSVPHSEQILPHSSPSPEHGGQTTGHLHALGTHWLRELVLLRRVYQWSLACAQQPWQHAVGHRRVHASEETDHVEHGAGRLHGLDVGLQPDNGHAGVSLRPGPLPRWVQRGETTAAAVFHQLCHTGICGVVNSAWDFADGKFECVQLYLIQVQSEISMTANSSHSWSWAARR